MIDPTTRQHIDVAFAMDHAYFFRVLFPGMTIDVSEIKDPDLVAIWRALLLGGEGMKLAP